MRASAALARSDLSVRLLQLSADRAMLADVEPSTAFWLLNNRSG